MQTTTMPAGALATATMHTLSFGAALGRMLRAMRTRRQLAGLDDRMLADLAISRADAMREARRAPWDTAPSDRRRRA
ncbi:DUF1127 domain-containing protein [Elioraea sp.]|uniref:DUF1127 domain-containing protein n=1 Tax=Elioraea sp. TaxID=2185103 RepID=UPI003F72F3D8